jgi:hypothetical protein
MRFRILSAALTATCVAAVPALAVAQGQTDSTGSAMGSRHVGNGAKRTTAPGMHTGTVGSNMRANGANHPTPSSTQGDVGPGGNNNGTLTKPK